MFALSDVDKNGHVDFAEFVLMQASDPGSVMDRLMSLSCGFVCQDPWRDLAEFSFWRIFYQGLDYCGVMH